MDNMDDINYFSRLPEDVKIKILLDLDDKDLVEMCSVNRKAKDLCNSPKYDRDLWMNKTLKALPNVSVEEHKNIMKDAGIEKWSDYYTNAVKRLISYENTAGRTIQRERRPPSKIKLWTGFDKPIVVDEEFRQFFINGNFGFKIPNDPSSGPLQRGFLLAQRGVTTRNILMMLINIYIEVNDLRYKINHPDTDKPEGTMVDRFKSDATMRRYLGKAFVEQGIDQDKMFYQNLVSIFSYHIRGNLTNIRLETKIRLTYDKTVATEAMMFHRKNRE